MSQAVRLARERILTPAGLAEPELEAMIDRLMAHGADAADLYFQASRFESWLTEEGVVKEGSHDIRQGVGLRAVSGDKTGFAYSDEVTLPALAEAATTARSIARGGRTGAVKVRRDVAGHTLYPPVDPIGSLSEEAKLGLLAAVDAEARRQDPRITQVIVSLAGEHRVVLVAASDGTLAADVRPLVRLGVTVIAESHGRREQGRAGGGARAGYEHFLDGERAVGWAREAARQALVNLEAEETPAGEMTVVLGPGWPGVLLHEAVGHGLEGDFNRKGTSAFSGRIGERVAARGVTVVDDGTLAGRRGSLGIDDEGTPTGRTVLIEDGILRGYLQDRLNARLMGVAPTGNGRRASYAHVPLPRMTNTYMLAGDHDPAEILASVDRGLYAVSFGGGQVDITSGKFVFSASEAYLIEGGRVTRPVRGATLIGNGPEVLGRVSLIGNDLALDEGVGTCGKEGQSVPVGVGQPTLRIDGLTVGGTRVGR
jgi:TldD protein